MKNRMIYAMAAVAMMAVGCQKDRNADGMLLLAEGFNNNGSKVLVDGLTSTWADGDEVRINDQTAAVSVTTGNASVHLGSGVDAPFYGVYPAGIYNSNSGASYTLNLPATYTHETDGTHQKLASPMVGYTDNSTSMTFKHLTAAVTVQVVNYHYDYAIVVDSIVVASNSYMLCGEITVSIGNDIAVAPVATDEASLKSVKMKMGTGLNVAAGDSTAVQVPVLPVGDGNKFTVTVWAHRADQPSVSVELTRTQNTGGSLLRANLGYARYTLGGPFSVSASKKVVFSKGNLQYQASTGAWRFATNQYDYIGDDNANIAADYAGWIDLFGWGTGNNPTNTSTTADDYSSFHEWGTAAASSIGSGWYTLSGDEWDYMIKTISATPGTNCRNTNTYEMPSNTATYVNAARYVKATIGSVPGLIIFPDVYIHPVGVTVTSTITSYNDSYGAYSKFVVNSGWEKMELVGAVFFPSAGERQGTAINNTGTFGNYYASSYIGTAGYHLYFKDGAMNSKTSTYPASNKSYGYSVRLVRDVE